MASIDKKLKKEIDETDYFIAGLGPVGQTFVEKLHATGMTILSIPDSMAIFPAAYDMTDDIYYCPAGLPLSLRFNYRVHEGAHALQAQNTPSLMQRLTVPMRLSPEGVVKYRRAMEQNACAVQGYFNTLAVAYTGNRDFINDLGRGKMSEAYKKLLQSLIRRNRSPLSVARAVARKLLDTPMQAPQHPLVENNRGTVRLGGVLDILSLQIYQNVKEAGVCAPDHPTDITPEELQSLLNSEIMLDHDGCLLHQHTAPLQLSPPLQKLLRELHP